MKYILIADDEEMNRNVLGDFLEDTYEVGFSEDGKACLSSINKRTPDLLLLDVSMPMLDGLEVCKRLRMEEQYADLPIIMLSGHASSASAQAGLDVGANAYLSKPFSLSDLRARIEEFINV